MLTQTNVYIYTVVIIEFFAVTKYVYVQAFHPWLQILLLAKYSQQTFKLKIL